MASQTSLKRVVWAVGVLLAAGSLLGLECQYEPLPDLRRGFLGDLCRADGTCEPCHKNQDGGCEGAFTCASGEDPPRCREECALSPAGTPFGSGVCGSCGPEARCSPVSLGDAGFSSVKGTCSPAPSEGQACAANGACAGCLQCATDPTTQQRTCRRQCDSNIDGGPAGTGITGSHPYCGYADLPETGAVILQNCCQFGQRCSPVVEDGENHNVCFGPLPGQPGSTCKPRSGVVGICETSGLCETGDPMRSIPNNCIPAGGLNQPCRSGTGCDPMLTCIAGPTSGPRPVCRKDCSTANEQCAACGDGWDCIPVIMGMANQGVCVPAVNEQVSCENGEFCSNCLVCGGVVGTPGSNRCRRSCAADVDAGNPDANVLLDPMNAADMARCPQPAAGATLLANCCPVGEGCLRFTLSDGGVGTGAACYPR